MYYKVKIKKLSPDAIIPSYAKTGDAGMDMVSTKIISDNLGAVTYGTDIAIEIPKGFVGLIFPRSSIRKTNLQLSNSVGVVDSGYRGEIQATFNKIQGIDNVEREVVRFDSFRHIRYENDLFISESEVERKISITFINSKETCQVEISPSLSPKQANLRSVNGNTYSYIGSDPDYLFIIDYDQFDNIEKFSLTLTNRNVRIDYFE